VCQLTADRPVTFNSDENGGVVLASPLIGRRDACVMRTIGLFGGGDGEPGTGSSYFGRLRQLHAVPVVNQLKLTAIPRHARHWPAPRPAVENQRISGNGALRPIETPNVRVRCYITLIFTISHRVAIAPQRRWD